MPGPAPVGTVGTGGSDRIINIFDNPGFWRVLKGKRHVARAFGADYAAEIWVRRATDEEIRQNP